MNAAVLYKLNEPLTVGDVTAPDLKHGQVLVRIAYSGVCHSQLMEARGKRGEDRYLPHLLGHEGSGIVEQVGAGVTKVRPGDRVVLGWIKGSGLEGGASVYRRGDHAVNSGAVTTFSEVTVVSENRCTLLPDGIPMDVAVLFGCALLTGAGIITQTIQPPAQSTLAFIGLGGIGLSALIASRLYECRQVIAVDVNEEKLSLAKKLGATHTINSAKFDVLEEIKKITAGRGVDFSIEAAGLASTIELAFKAVRQGGGLCVFASHPASGIKIALDPHDLISGKRIQGTWGGGCLPDREIPFFSDLYLKGQLPLELLLDKRYRLDQINEALKDLEEMKVIRPLIEINPLLGVQK